MESEANVTPSKASPSTSMVSVVIAARDEARQIRACLEALADQHYPSHRLEIIVADGSSTDATRDIVRAFAERDPRVRLIDNPARVTPAGLNAAIAASRGDFIVWMSGHALANEEHVADCVAGLLRTEAWAIGGAISRTWKTSRQEANGLATSSPFGVGDAVHNYADEGRWVETAFPGAWPRWVFERVGLFDPELRRNQDDELSYRIRQAGGRIWYDPSIRVAYTPRPTLLALASQYRQYGCYKVRVFQKHPRAIRWRHLAPGALVVYLLAAPVVILALPALLPVVATGYLAYGTFVVLAVARIRREAATRRQLASSLIGIHLGYGLGLIQGMLKFAPRWFVNRAAPAPRLARRGDDNGGAATRASLELRGPAQQG